MYWDPGDGHWINEVRDSGRFILLEDGSLWEVAPINQAETCIWLPTAEIEVLENDDPIYPYKIVNKDEEEVVDAKFIGTE